MKKFLVVILGMVLLAAVGCGSEQKQADGKLPVVASFYPMADFTRQIGGDLLQVDTLIADGVEPHDWEPTAKDLTKLGNARLFVYNGGGGDTGPPGLHRLRRGRELGPACFRSCKGQAGSQCGGRQRAV